MPALDMTLARDGKICFLTSSVGRKLLMALTGFSFVCFVTGHTAGNLTAYMGHWDGGAMMNEYAAFLQGFAHGAGIWVARAGLLGLLFIHVTVAAWLTLDSWTARPKGYKKRKLEATWQSRTMRYTAVILIAFVAYHLLHMTLGWAPIHRHFEHGNAYSNFVNGFSDPLTSGIYIIANLCLFLHLWHGIWSFSQTLGLSHPRYEKLRKYAAGLWAFGVAGINISFPIAVLTGFLR